VHLCVYVSSKDAIYPKKKKKIAAKNWVKFLLQLPAQFKITPKKQCWQKHKIWTSAKSIFVK
jgi:hypothetical protein